MAKRNNISIKTNYKSIEECKENCRDYKGRTRISTNFLRQISGEIHEDGSFILSSRMKGSAMFEFIGKIIEKPDGVYMIGDIRPKPIQLKIIYVSIVLMSLLGFLFIFTMGVVGLLFGAIFLIGPWFNLILINKSDYLYNDIIRKVSK